MIKQASREVVISPSHSMFIGDSKMIAITPALGTQRRLLWVYRGQEQHFG
jgi:hypothetical protein